MAKYINRPIELSMHLCLNSKNYFQKAIQIDPKLENAYLGLANLTLKKDTEITNEMNNTGTSNAGQQKFKALKQQKIAIYKEALEFLNQAKSINSQNESINSLMDEIQLYLYSEK